MTVNINLYHIVSHLDAMNLEAESEDEAYSKYCYFSVFNVARDQVTISLV